MWVVPAIHPAATFRQPGQLGPLKAHIAGFVRRTLTGEPASKLPRVSVNPPLSELLRLLDAARHHRLPLSVDVETGQHGNLASHARLRAIGVGIDHGAGLGMSWAWQPGPAIIRELAAAFADPKLIKLFVNGWAYDIPILTRYGFKIRGPVHDIRDSRRALDSTSRVSLAAQASYYLTVAPWKREAVVDDDEKGHVSESTPLEKLLPYNALDCVYAAQIRRHHKRELREEGPRVQRIYRQLLRLARVGGDIHVKGLYFFRSEQARLRKELLDTFRARKAELQTLLRKRGGSNFRITDRGGVNESDLKALLFRQCAKPGIKSFGLEVPLSDKSWTEGGKPAVNRDALLVLFSQSNTPDEAKAIIRACWKVDAPLKLLSTFVESKLIEDAIGPDGHIHPKVNTVGTETYRWACKSPNLMNLPEAKDADAGALQGTLPNVRALYGAPPGFVVVHRDFSQLELEVMAEYTGDPVLKAGLAAGDVHSARARDWFGIPEGEPVPKALRRQTKIVGFSSQYGAGIETVYSKVLEQDPDADFTETEALFTTFREKHPRIVEFWKTSLEQATTLGYSEAPIMGYRRYYPPGHTISHTDTSNYPIQGGAAAIANCTMVGIDSWEGSLYARLRAEHPRAWLALHTYDSFDVICPEKEAEAVDKLLNECMQGPWQIGDAPKLFKSDGKIGQKLSDV